MRKLKLEIDDLEVTSFAATSETSGAERGTVEAHKTDPFTNNGAFTCNGEVTCAVSCANTCGGTCAGGVCGSWPLTYCPQCYYED